MRNSLDMRNRPRRRLSAVRNRHECEKYGLHLQQRVQSGAYPEIFRSVDDAKCLSYSLAGTHPSNVAQGLINPDHDRQRGETFAAECEDAETFKVIDFATRKDQAPVYGM
jgi:hypothetical protein